MTIIWDPAFDRQRIEMGRMLEKGMHGYGLRVYRGQKGAGVGTAAAIGVSAGIAAGKKFLVPIAKKVVTRHVVPAAKRLVKRTAAAFGRKALATANRKARKVVKTAAAKATPYVGKKTTTAAVRDINKMMRAANKRANTYIDSIDSGAPKNKKRVANKRANTYIDSGAPKNKKRKYRAPPKPSRPGRRGLPPLWR